MIRQACFDPTQGLDHENPSWFYRTHLSRAFLSFTSLMFSMQGTKVQMCLWVQVLQTNQGKKRYRQGNFIKNVIFFTGKQQRGILKKMGTLVRMWIEPMYLLKLMTKKYPNWFVWLFSFNHTIKTNFCLIIFLESYNKNKLKRI